MINIFKEIKFYKCKFLDEFNRNTFKPDQMRKSIQVMNWNSMRR